MSGPSRALRTRLAPFAVLTLIWGAAVAASLIAPQNAARADKAHGATAQDQAHGL